MAKKKPVKKPVKKNRPSTEIIRKLKAWAKNESEAAGLTSLLVSPNKKEVWELADVIYWAAVEVIEGRED